MGKLSDAILSGNEIPVESGGAKLSKIFNISKSRDKEILKMFSRASIHWLSNKSYYHPAHFVKALEEAGYVPESETELIYMGFRIAEIMRMLNESEAAAKVRFLAQIMDFGSLEQKDHINMLLEKAMVQMFPDGEDDEDDEVTPTEQPSEERTDFRKE